MSLLLKNGAVFLHIPKTGGSWVTRALEDSGLVKCYLVHRHADMERTVNCVRYDPRRIRRKSLRFGLAWHKDIAEAYKFCFVRNPIDWYESWWRYMTDRSWHNWGPDYKGKDWHPCTGLDNLGSPNFNKFIENVLKHQPGFVSRLYASYVTGPMNFVGRQENLVEDLISALEQAELAFDCERIRALAKVNESKRHPITWDPDLKLAVQATEANASQLCEQAAALTP